MLKRILLLSCVVALFTSLGLSQATRTWISGVGDDANPCSRTAPCKTFAGAISKTAAAGEIDALDEGGFGAITITKSITLDGAVLGGVLVSGTNGIVVSTASTDVVILRNLDIDGFNSGLNGIEFIGAGTLIVENCKIFGFTYNGISFQPTVSGTKLSVKDTNIANVVPAAGQVGAGINITSGSVLLTNVHVDNAAKGIYNQGGAVTAYGVTLTNAGNGFNQNAGGGSMYLDHCVATSGFNGVYSQAGTVTMTACEITHNTNGLNHVAGGQILSYGDNHVYGNTTNGTPSGTATAE